MKRIAFLYAALLAGVSSCAMAEPFEWSGLYIAGQFSGESSDLSGRFVQPTGGITELSSLTDVVGASFGIAIGNNWQFDNAIVGFEARWSGTSVDESENLVFGGVSQTRTFGELITFGPRLGMAWGRWHVYGTAGLATSGYRAVTTEVSLFGGTETTLNTVDERLYGHFVGVGMEWAVSTNIILGLEYNSTSLSVDKASWTDAAGVLTVFEGDDPSMDKITARVALKF